MTVQEKFPSPCGDYGSYQAQHGSWTIYAVSFRPLAGIMVLINSVLPKKVLTLT